MFKKILKSIVIVYRSIQVGLSGTSPRTEPLKKFKKARFLNLRLRSLRSRRLLGRCPELGGRPKCFHFVFVSDIK